MTTETLFTDDQPLLRFKIIRPVYETLTVNDAAAQYFEPRTGNAGMQDVSALLL